MDHLNNNTEIIDAYLLGRLEGEDLINFEARLEKDEQLKEAVLVQQQIIKGLTNYGNERLRERLGRIRSEQQKKALKVTSRRRIVRWVSAAAAAVLLLLIAQFGFNDARSSNPFADYYQTYELTTGSRSTTESDAQLVRIGQLYNAGKFREALPEMRQYITEHPENVKLQLATAIAHIELEQQVLALPYFDAILALNDPLFGDHARWYKALCLIKIEREDEAKPLLQVLAADPDADHHQEATELLQAL